MEFFYMKQKTKKVTKQKKPKQKTAKICEKVLQCRREFRVQETICQVHTLDFSVYAE